MKRALCLGLALAGCVGILTPVLGQYGPGQQGAVLKSPFNETAPPISQKPANNGYVQGMWDKNPPLPNAGQSTSFLNPGAPQVNADRTAVTDLSGGLSLPEEGPDPNQDIAVSDKEGPWMISIASYMGNDAPRMARAMAVELRDQYRLPAFVFSRGREERKKEYKRVKDLLDQQRKFFRENQLPEPSNLRVKYRVVQEQCAVLVGNYTTLDAARSALNGIRRLAPPDPKRVSLMTQFVGKIDPNTKRIGKNEKGEGEHVYVNPFKQAFVVHNPVRKQEDGGDPNVDINALRQLNRGEKFSLLDCKKPFTLVVKQFFTPSTIQTMSVKGAAFMENLTLGNENDREDIAAQNANALAEVFRKANLDAYVLHTRYSSIVAVGSFDSLDDPRVESTRHMLTTQLGVPQAIPMRVPR